MQISHPLDVFVTTNTERQILNIFVAKLTEVSPRKRKAATEMAVGLLRQKDAPKFPDALAQSLTAMEKGEHLN